LLYLLNRPSHSAQRRVRVAAAGISAVRSPDTDFHSLVNSLMVRPNWPVPVRGYCQMSALACPDVSAPGTTAAVAWVLITGDNSTCLGL
jgi:hypothetical protein